MGNDSLFTLKPFENILNANESDAHNSVNFKSFTYICPYNIVPNSQFSYT